MRKIAGMPLKILGVISFIIFGLWGLFLEVAIVNEVAGFLGVVLGFMLLPVMFAVVPWYAGVVWGNWLPLMVCYGGGILTAILFGLGSIIAGDD